MMTDADARLMLTILRKVQADIAKIDLHLDDMAENMRRMQADIGGLRGSNGAVQHDLAVLTGRWRDIEVRVRALEGDE